MFNLYFQQKEPQSCQFATYRRNALFEVLTSQKEKLLLLLSKHIFGFYKIQIWFFTLEPKNKNEKYLKSRKISKISKKFVKSRKKKRISWWQVRLPTEKQIEVNWLSVKRTKVKKQVHNLVKHSTRWGTKKESVFWIRQKGALGLAKLKFRCISERLKKRKAWVHNRQKMTKGKTIEKQIKIWSYQD